MKGVAAGAIALIVVAVLPGQMRGQNLAGSIDRMRDGVIRLSFAVREDVCSQGDGITWSSGDAHWEPVCGTGPARVVIERRVGTIKDIDTHVGGRWRANADVVDLGAVPAREAAEYFLGIARSADDDVAKDAMFAAAIADSVSVWRDMMSIAEDESVSMEARESGLFWAGQLGDETVVGMLVGFIRSSQRETLRDRAVFGLSQNKSDAALRALQDIVSDKGAASSLRERAIFWLGQRRGVSHTYLRNLYGSLSDIDLKERVIFSVSQRATDEDWGWLIARAASESEPMSLREKAIFWAGQSRHEGSDLIDLYDRIASRELKEKLVFAYSQRRNDEQALTKLFEIAREERDSHLRGRAIFWLGQSKDPRAVEFLAELIG